MTGNPEELTKEQLLEENEMLRKNIKQLEREAESLRQLIRYANRQRSF